MSLSSMDSIEQTVFELDSGNENVDGQTDGQTDKKRTNEQKKTNRWNCTNFERNLAMMVIYVPVKYEFNWTNFFRVRFRKRKCGWTDKWTKNVQMNRRNFPKFERNLPMMVIYLPVKFEFYWTNCFRVRVRK